MNLLSFQQKTVLYSLQIDIDKVFYKKHLNYNQYEGESKLDFELFIAIEVIKFN